jgi:hypothetical protein
MPAICFPGAIDALGKAAVFLLAYTFREPTRNSMIVCSMRRLGLAFVVLAAFGLAIGCSQSGDDLPREPVSGTVTLDGQPLPNGTISFIPVTGSGGGGGTITDGKFSIAREGGPVPGSYTVAIYASATQGEQTKPKMAGGTRKESQLAKELIPAKYNANTELKAEIKKGGNNDLKFVLESK